MGRVRPRATAGPLAAVLFALASAADAADPWDPVDDTGPGATLLAPTVQFQYHGTHTLDENDPYDWYVIPMTQGTTYHLEGANIDNDFSGDSVGVLYADPNGDTVVISNDDYGYGLQFLIQYNAAATQLYYLRVRRYSSFGRWTGDIRYAVVVPGLVETPRGRTAATTCDYLQFWAGGFATAASIVDYVWDFNGDGIEDDVQSAISGAFEPSSATRFEVPGTYSVRVKVRDSPSGLESGWSSSLVVIITDPSDDDAGSGGDVGDSCSLPTRIPPMTGTGYVTYDCDRYDYYEFYAEVGNRVEISVTPTGWADVDVALYNPSCGFERWSTGAGANDAEYISFTVSQQGMWKFRVEADYREGGKYLFSLSGVPSPAVPSSRVVPSQSTLNTGQALTVSVFIDNLGDYDATGFDGALSVSVGGASLTKTSGPIPSGASTLTAGSTRTELYTFVATATPGAVTLTYTGSGIDGLTGSPTGTVSSGGVTVQTPAALAASVGVSATVVKEGRTFEVVLSVTNTGQATAVGVAAALRSAPPGLVSPSTSPSSATVMIAGGASRRFTWTYLAQNPGTADFTATATGTDGNDASALTAPATSPSLLITSAAVFDSAVVVSPSTVRQGETITLTMTVTNTGSGAGTGVSATALLSSGAGASAVPLAVPAVSATGLWMAGGSSTTFTWTFAANVAGALSLTVTVSGLDVQDGGAVTTSGSAAATILSLLDAFAQVSPAVVTQGEGFVLRFTVSNTGSVPAVLSLPGFGANDPRLISVLAGPSLPVSVLAPGTATVFAWSLLSDGGGALVLTPSIAGASGSIAVTAQASTGAQVNRRFLNEPIVPYPNPVTGDLLRVALTLGRTANRVVVRVYNAGRDLVYEGLWTDLEAGFGDLDISGVSAWAPGLYLVHVRAVLVDGTEQRFPVVKVMVRR